MVSARAAERARKLKKIGSELVAQIAEAWKRKNLEPWQRKRLAVVRMIARHRLDAKGIAVAAGVSRARVFNYRDILMEKGIDGLLSRRRAGARKPAVRGTVAVEFGQALEKGKFRQAKDAQAWIARRTRKQLTAGGAWKVLRRLGGKLKVPRKSDAKKDQARADERRARV